MRFYNILEFFLNSRGTLSFFRTLHCAVDRYVNIINVTVVYLYRLGRYVLIPPKLDAMVLNSTCFMLLLAALWSM